MKLRILATIAAALLLTAGAAACAPSPTTAAIEVRLNDSVAAVELSRSLPSTMSFDNRMGTAQVARLAAPLSTRGAATAPSYRAGDVAYWAAEQSIVIFLHDGSGVPTSGLVLIGHTSGDLSRIGDCTRQCTLSPTSRGDETVQS